MKRTTVINIYGGSGVGKSVTSAKLYAEMSISPSYGDIELVREYAKDLVWSGDMKTLKHQPSVTSEQIRRQSILYGKVDFIITDSPIRLGEIYASQEYLEEVCRMIDEEEKKYSEVNILLKRSSDVSFVQNGRVHSLEESIGIDAEIKRMLDRHNKRYVELSNKLDVLSIMREIEKEIMSSQ